MYVSRKNTFFEDHSPRPETLVCPLSKTESHSRRRKNTRLNSSSVLGRSGAKRPNEDKVANVGHRLSSSCLMMGLYFRPYSSLELRHGLFHFQPSIPDLALDLSTPTSGKAASSCTRHNVAKSLPPPSPGNVCTFHGIHTQRTGLKNAPGI